MYWCDSVKLTNKNIRAYSSTLKKETRLGQLVFTALKQIIEYHMVFFVISRRRMSDRYNLTLYRQRCAVQCMYMLVSEVVTLCKHVHKR